MNALRSAYDLLPPPLANTALSVFGLRNLTRRRRWSRMLATVAPSETWDEHQRCQYVANRLRVLVAHAVASVPRYEQYRRLLPELGGADADVVRLLRELPVITKDEILDQPQAFMSSAVPDRSCATTRTSGTTGTPLAIRMTHHALAMSDALWWRRTVWAGYQPGDVIARLVGDPVVPLHGPWSRRPVRRSRTDKRLYLSSFHLDGRSALQMGTAVQRVRPAFVMGYPSSLHAWVNLVGEPIATDEWAPRAVLYSSEPMYAHQREAIAESFRAPIRGLYGCAERVLSAAECQQGNLHLGVVDGYLEGQFSFEDPPDGPYVCGLLNEAMPLLRYDVGDTLRLAGDACACGRTLPILAPVVTKAEDSVVTPTGRWVSPSALTWAFKHVRGLRKSQIIQRSAEELEVLLDISESDYAAAAEELSARLKELTFAEMRVRLTRTTCVPVTRGGKTRFVVNEYRSDARVC